MNQEIIEALRSAQEMLAFLWNNVNAEAPEDGNVELLVHSDSHAASLSALMNDAKTRIDAALHGLELQSGAIGDTRGCTHPQCNCWMGVCGKGPPASNSEAMTELAGLWPDLRQLVDGFTVNSAWGSEWDVRVRQRMIDFGVNYLMKFSKEKRNVTNG